MALSNTAVPKYYGMFRDAVLRGDDGCLRCLQAK